MPTILIHEWPLAATLFDGDRAGGPVPSLFCANEEATSAAITADPAKAHWDVNKLAKSFFTAENTILKNIIPLLKRPR